MKIRGMVEAPPCVDAGGFSVTIQDVTVARSLTKASVDRTAITLAVETAGSQVPKVRAMFITRRLVEPDPRQDVAALRDLAAALPAGRSASRDQFTVGPKLDVDHLPEFTGPLRDSTECSHLGVRADFVAGGGTGRVLVADLVRGRVETHTQDLRECLPVYHDTPLALHTRGFASDFDGHLYGPVRRLF